MLKKLVHTALAVATISAVTIVTTDDAEARRGRRIGGLVFGTAIGLGIAGAIASDRYRYGYRGYGPGYYGRGHGPHYGYGAYTTYGGCHPGPVRCRWSYSRGREICYRPTYCY